MLPEQPWLSNRGYNSAFQGSSTFIGKLSRVLGGPGGDFEPVSREFLEKIYANFLDNQYVTEVAIRRLGLAVGDYNPGNIPSVNEVLFYQQFSSKGQYRVEVGGMPGAAKSAFLERVRKANVKRIVCTEEPYTFVKETGRYDPLDDVSTQAMRFHTELAMLMFGEIEFLLRRVSNGILVFDRWVKDDLAFSRARDLRGDISPEAYVEEYWDVSQEVDALLILMVPPDVSLERKSSSGTGRYLNLGFLSVLYEQYVRTIFELREKRQPNLAVLDLSGDDQEANYRLFRRTLEKIIGVRLSWQSFIGR